MKCLHNNRIIVEQLFGFDNFTILLLYNNLLNLCIARGTNDIRTIVRCVYASHYIGHCFSSPRPRGT